MVLFPLLLLSGVLLPVESGPAWLRVVGRINPVTYIVEAQRALFAGDLTDVRSCTARRPPAFAVAALGLWLGNRAMRRGV